MSSENVYINDYGLALHFTPLGDVYSRDQPVITPTPAYNTSLRTFKRDVWIY